MTDARLTQQSLEEWASTNPQVQATQISVEQWASVQTTTSQVILSQICIEQWASIAAPDAAQAVRVMMLA